MRNQDQKNPGGADIYNVTRLNREVRAVLEGSFPSIWIRGEISNLARPASGHIYFSLKDQHSQVRCAMFKNRLRGISFNAENGLEILARANVSLYEGRGEFQLILEHMEPAGEGALQRAFEELKQQLSKEGLFDATHKKSLPAFPGTIGVITSPSGAAIRDILQVCARRYRSARIIVYPVAVQGSASSQEIVKALNLVDKRDECDVVILARGGGSLEDMMSFNDEKVARTIFNLKTPLVSGVGHEIDITIADFIADQRAPTPSAAAELVCPDTRELEERLAGLNTQMSRLLKQNLNQLQQTLVHFEKRLPHPLRQLEILAQRIDNTSMRLQGAAGAMLSKKNALLSDVAGRVQQFNPLHKLDLNRQKNLTLATRLEKAVSYVIETQQNRIKQAVHSLNTVSPLATLERGYAIVSDEEKVLVRNTAEIKVGDRVNTRLSKGGFQSRIEKIDIDPDD